MLVSLDIRVIIRKQGNDYIAVTEQRNGQQICTNIFHHDPTQLMLVEAPEPRPEPASRIVRSITRRRHRDPHTIQSAQFGAQLYQYAFGSGRALREFIRTNRDVDVVRLTIVFTPNTEVLGRLPWEYLYDGKAFLGINQKVQIVRQPVKHPVLAPEPSHSPLRVLVLIANPYDQKPFSVESELAHIQEVLKASIVGRKVELDVLNEVTTHAVRRILHQKSYHILYFIGYGKYNLMQQRGYLCIEDDVGYTELLGASHLKKMLQQNKPHLIILSGRTKTDGGGRDPYHGFALECLQEGIAAVLNIPASLHADSRDNLIRTFFSGLSEGQSIAESISGVRRLLFDLDAKLVNNRRFDWGMPICFIGTERVQPILSAEEPEAETQVRSQPLFAGRKREIQILRKALKENISVIYLWGHNGAGKSALIHQLLYHTGVKFKGILRIKCDELREPLSILSKISNFWARHTPVEHQHAADLLLDSRQDPFVRAQAAQQHIGQYRYLLVIENIDVWLAEPNSQTTTKDTGNIMYPLIRSILLGLLHAQSNTTFLFTGARRWNDLSDLPSNNRRDLPLPFLKPVWAAQLLSSLPGSDAISQQLKETIFWHIGGHPLAIKLFSAWRILTYERDLQEFFQDPPLQNRSTLEWIDYFIHEIIDQLDPGEAQVLPITAVLNRPFSAKVLPNLSLVSSPYAGALLTTWRRVELIQHTEIKGQYNFHLLVRSHILERIPAEEIRQLHLQAAKYYGAPFVDEARRQIYTRNAGYQSEERIAWLARDSNGILGTWLRQEQDTERYQELLDLAMSWHYHLYNAVEYKAAVQVARAIVPVLHHLGLRDLAGELLQRAISAAEGYVRAAGMDELAKLQIADGHLAGALDVYDEVYKALLTHGTSLQRAHVLTRSARVQQQLGLLDESIKRYEQALQIMRQEREKQGQVVCLYQLSIVYRAQGNLSQALVYSQAAKELYDKLIDNRGLASAAHEQGHILRDMEHLDGALENFAESMRICRRLGDLYCVAGNLYQIGDVLHKLGKTEMAIRTLEEAEALYAMLSAPERVDVLHLLEELYEKQQRLTDAVQRFRTVKNSSVKK